MSKSNRLKANTLERTFMFFVLFVVSLPASLQCMRPR
jgi:hypothetical protein